MKIENKIRKCRHCVNYLFWSEDDLECDFEYWKENKIKNALLFTPEQFDCNHYEKKPE